MIRLQWVKQHPFGNELIRERFNSMREASILTDMMISTGPSSFHPCHKYVVGSASSYLLGLIKATTTLHNGKIPVIAINEIHRPYLNSLFEFLYRGVLVIKVEEFQGLCKLADKLRIKMLVDGFQEIKTPDKPRATHGINLIPDKNKSLNEPKTTKKPRNVQKTNVQAAEKRKKNQATSVVPTKKRKQAPQETKKPSKKLEANAPKRKYQKKNPGKEDIRPPDIPAPLIAVPVNGNCTQKSPINKNLSLTGLALAQRLKKRAKDFLASPHKHSLSFKVISRRKKKVVRRYSYHKDPMKSSELEESSGVDKSQPEAAMNRPRRKAFHDAKVKMKIITTQLRKN